MQNPTNTSRYPSRVHDKKPTTLRRSNRNTRRTAQENFHLFPQCRHSQKVVMGSSALRVCACV
jgi:hypothetical protein